MIEKNWKELLAPISLQKKLERKSLCSATITTEPLERGFGMTLGNALRRVLLSGLQGAAVTGVQIDGVVHEFTSISGIREDVTNIVLNLKGLVLRMEADGPKKLILRKTGSGPVTGANIEETADVEILNKDHVICTAYDNADIRMELTVTRGKGYVPAAMSRTVDAPIGLIFIDALYSPVKRVAYRVEDTRDGQVCNYDKLVIDVETNGSVTPEEAVTVAARIIQEQFQVFVNFEDAEYVDEPSVTMTDTSETEKNKMLGYVDPFNDAKAKVSVELKHTTIEEISGGVLDAFRALSATRV